MDIEPLHPETLAAVVPGARTGGGRSTRRSSPRRRSTSAPMSSTAATAIQGGWLRGGARRARGRPLRDVRLRPCRDERAPRRSRSARGPSPQRAPYFGVSALMRSGPGAASSSTRARPLTVDGLPGSIDGAGLVWIGIADQPDARRRRPAAVIGLGKGAGAMVVVDNTSRRRSRRGRCRSAPTSSCTPSRS